MRIDSFNNQPTAFATSLPTPQTGATLQGNDQVVFSGWKRRAHPPTIPQNVNKALQTVRQQNPELFQHTTCSPEVWLAQFETVAEQLLAVKLLAHFQFFDVDAIRQASSQLHQWLLSQPGFDLETAKFTHFATGKSGGLIQYFYRQASQLPNQASMAFDLALAPPEIVPGKPVNTLVLVDDFLGSGAEADYFLTCLAEALNAQGKTYKQIYFLPIVAYQEGIDRLVKKFSGPPLNLKVHGAIQPPKVLDTTSSYFSDDEKTQLNTMMKKYAERVYPQERFGPVATPFGYRNGQALVGFFYNTPTNTLPIFWSGFNGWQPLFRRYDSFNKDTGHWTFVKTD